jgi:YVTN family beta-propeller protein
MNRKFTNLILVATFFLGVMNADAQIAYVPNEHDNTISVINVLNNSVLNLIHVGISPYGVSVSPDGFRVYFTCGDEVSVLNTATDSIITTIPVVSPTGIAVSPNDSLVYVAQSGGTVSVINTNTYSITSTITVGSEPYGIVVTPDGNKVYVANYFDSSVFVINTITNTVSDTIKFSEFTYPKGLAVSPDGSRVYVTNYDMPGTLSVINTAVDTVIATLNIGFFPCGVAVSPDGSKVYVANGSSNNIGVVNAATNTGLTAISVGQHPLGISLTPDGSKLYVANAGVNTVSVINTASDTVSATITVGNNPSAFGNFISIYPSHTGIPSLTPPSPTITLYPNPANTILNIHTNSQLSILNSQLIITDIMGNEVYHELLPSNVNSQLSIVNWSAGVYFYEVRGQEGSARGKFVVQK